jgi:hypothetical protein
MAAPAVPKSASINDILNRVAVEIGLSPEADPFGSTADYFVQLKTLLAVAAEELALAWKWQQQNREHTITTAPGDTGKYPLPVDFNYMIDQAGWVRSSQQPLAGPVSNQEWQYLLGTNTTSITVAFRLNQGEFWLFPQPPASGQTIKFEYQSKWWAMDPTNPTWTGCTDTPDNGSFIVLYDRLLISRLLKTKSLDAKGYDSTRAQADTDQAFMFLTGKDKTAPILNAAFGGALGFRYIGGQSVPSSGYGL